MDDQTTLVNEIDEAPPSEEALRLAQAAVGHFGALCFWFWRPGATVRTREDVALVLRQLRLHGGREGWREAARIQSCL